MPPKAHFFCMEMVLRNVERPASYNKVRIFYHGVCGHKLHNRAVVPPGQCPQGITLLHPVAPGLACPRRQGDGGRRLICFHEPLDHLGKFGAGSPGLGGQRSGAALQKPGAHGPLHRLFRPCGDVSAVCVRSQAIPLDSVPFLKLRVAVEDDRKLFTGDRPPWAASPLAARRRADRLKSVFLSFSTSSFFLVVQNLTAVFTGN